MTHILITVEGGVVQAVSADDPEAVEVFLIDWDDQPDGRPARFPVDRAPQPLPE